MQSVLVEKVEPRNGGKLCNRWNENVSGSSELSVGMTHSACHSIACNLVSFSPEMCS